MSDESVTGQGTFPTPPYIAYKTFQTLLGDFSEHGLPPQIDRSVMTRFSGGVQSQLMIALRAIEFIDENSRPTPVFKQIVDAFDTDQYAIEIRKMVERTYPYVLKLDLTTATPSMFAQSFSEATSAREDSLRKCRAFFLAAAKDAGIEIGTRIENAKFPRSKSSSPRKPRAKKAVSSEESAPPTGAEQQQPKITEKALEYRLVDLMTQAAGDADVMQAIITVVMFLKTREAKEKATDE